MLQAPGFINHKFIIANGMSPVLKPRELKINISCKISKKLHHKQGVKRKKLEFYRLLDRKK